MRQLGATVRIESVDVSERREVERLLTGLNEAGITLHGVIHAAGVLADRTVSSMRRDDLRVVMAGKAAGAQHLFDLLPASVEVFVM
jgi:short-subunit dehydrogenase